MAKKQRKFVDDGWAIWTDGDDVCTIYLHEWLNPKGMSHVDLAIRVYNIKASTRMRVYIPFDISREEIQDVSLHFNETKTLQAIFGSACIVDYKKNDFTSEIAYSGKIVDIMHISTMSYQISALASGTLLEIDYKDIQQFIDNDEAYFIWRMPHKSLDKLFKSRVGAGSKMSRFRDLFTSPVLSEKYGYSVRINEPRLLPEEIRHFEEDLYKDYIPDQYDTDDVISYEWCQNRESNLQEQFNFYYNIAKNSVSRGSMIVYLILITAISCLGSFLANVITHYMGW